MNTFIKREYDYALRICAYLAEHYQEGPISLGTISEKLFISRHFANKIVHKLKKNNLIVTVQGKQGGIYLNRNPRELSLFDILQAMGFDSTLNACITTPDICPLVSICQIHDFLVDQEEYLIKQLKARKIADSHFRFED